MNENDSIASEEKEACKKEKEASKKNPSDKENTNKIKRLAKITQKAPNNKYILKNNF